MEAAEAVTRDNPGVDRISNLPINLRECILEKLPICDVIRTSILSTNWRHSWKGIECLEFDRDFKMRFHKSRTFQTDKFVNAMETILFHRNRASRKVAISVPYLGKRPPLDIGPWLLYLSENKIEDLTIHYHRVGSDWFKFPSSVFSCAGLTHLKVISCEIEPSLDVRGFSHLISLHLYGGVIPTKSFESIIENSTLLESLSIRYCHFTVDGHSSKSVLIHCPKLRTLHATMACELYLVPTPYLTVVILRESYVVKVGDRKTCNLIEFLGLLPKVEDYVQDLDENDKYVRKNLHGFSAEDIPRRLPETIGNLKRVTLEQMDTRRAIDISYIFCLIRSSPSLTTLELSLWEVKYGVEKTYENEDEDPKVIALRCLKAQGGDGISSSSITSINMMHVRGFEHEMLLIKLSLSCCKALKILRVMAHKSVKPRVENQMLREMTRFPRTSPDAELIFSKLKHVRKSPILCG